MNYLRSKTNRFHRQNQEAGWNNDQSQPVENYSTPVRRQNNSISFGDERIERELMAIQRGSYDFYVKGGFSRKRRSMVSPIQVARQYGLNLSKCLFDMNDSRIELAVIQKNLQIVTPTTHFNRSENQEQPKIYTWSSDDNA